MNRNNNKQAIIFIGIQGGGKTSFYREHFPDLVHINLDTLHTRFQEKKALESCIQNEQSFVVDNTNPVKADRQRYISLAKENGYRIIGYYFESKIVDCVNRNSMREGKAKIPAKAIVFTCNRLELPE